MRALSLLALLLFAASACSSYSAQADPPVEHREQITIKLEQAVLAKDALKGVTQQTVVELLRKGLVVVDTPREIRAQIAAGVAEGRITLTDTLNTTTLAGVPVRFIPSGAGKQPVLGGSMLPRVSEGRLAVELDLTHGPKNGRVHTGQTVREIASVADGGMILIRFAGGKDAKREHLVLLTVSRVPPAAEPVAAE